MPTQLDKVIYTAKAHTTGGREGRSVTDDGLLDVKLAPPKELGGKGGATNPEQLFAAGYSACFMGALKHVAGIKKVAVPDDASIDASVDIGGRTIAVGVQPDRLKAAEATIPLGRGGTPEEAAGAVYMFCIPESNYVSGQVLVCGGGRP